MGRFTNWTLAFVIPGNTLSPAGDAARSISQLSWLIYIAFGAIALFMLLFILWIATRRKGTFDRHEPVGIAGGQSWLLIGGFAIPGVVLTVIFILGLKTLSGFPMHDGHEAIHPAEIRIIGHQWWWEVQYLTGSTNQHFRTANEIHIPAGRNVEIELNSADVIHSFWVPRLHGKIDLIPGMPNQIRVRADAPGDFHGQCAEFCGSQHAHMLIEVIAQSTEDYEAWLAHEREDASAADGESAIRGQQIFLSKPCALCHSVRGTLALASVAPDLTHIASRRKIATNMLDNNDANLSAWITHAQSLKPGVKMPDVTQFTGEELQEVVAYLKQLR